MEKDKQCIQAEELLLLLNSLNVIDFILIGKRLIKNYIKARYEEKN